MRYVSLTDNVHLPCNKYIGMNWHSSDNLGKEQVLTRIGHLGLTPLSVLTTCGDTLIGLISGIATILTIGLHKPLVNFTFNHFAASQLILTIPFRHLVRVLNARAQFSGDEKFTTKAKAEAKVLKEKLPLVSGDGYGFITHYVFTPIHKAALTYSSHDNRWVRWGVSRLTFALLAIATLVTRAVDLVIGILAATFSILTLGLIETSNNIANRALQAPGIINDLFFCTLKFIYPQCHIQMMRHD